VSLLGPLRLERHYYHCPACGRGFCPWDAELGVTAATLSPAAAEVACVAGVQTSFAEASAKVLPKLAGLRLAESTVERSTEAAGERLAAAQASGQPSAPAQAWAWHRDREGKTVAYVAVDATGVAQQGATGAKAEGRMANVAVLYNPVPDDPTQWADPAVGREPTWQARYLASLEPMAAVGTLLQQQGSAVGRARGALDCPVRWRQRVERRCARISTEAVILDFIMPPNIWSALAKSWGGRSSCGGSAGATRRRRGGVSHVTRVGLRGVRPPGQLPDYRRYGESVASGGHPHHQAKGR
jgi:hypothetical protein